MSKTGKYVLWATAAVVAIFLAWYFSNIVAYILISAVVAIVGKPIIDAILRIDIKGWKPPRWLAAMLTVIMMWVLVLLFSTLFFPLLFGKLGELSRIDIQQLSAAFREPFESLERFLVGFFAVDDGAFSLADQMAGEVAGFINLDSINSLLSSVVSMLAGTMVALFSVTFISFFFLKEENLFRNMVVALFPKKYEKNVNHAIGSATRLLMRYFTGIIGQSSIIFILVSALLVIFGFTPQTGIFMGVVMAVFNIIPYVGPILGTLVCLLVAMISPGAAYGMTGAVLITGGVIIAVKLLDDLVVQPMLYPNHLSTHPLETFIVVLAGASIGSGVSSAFVGMLVAIPVYMVVRVFAREFFYNFRLVRELTQNIEEV